MSAAAAPNVPQKPPPRLTYSAKARTIAAMEVILAKEEDLEALEALYAKARAFMREHGNGGQWGEHYPPRALLLEDIKKARMHLIKDGDELWGAFVFFVGEEPAYRAIDGKWLTDNTQYGVIHRVASAGKGGFMRRVVEFCEARTDDLRIDTHRDNAPMRGALETLGFVPCGTVIVDDGTERIAYEICSRISFASQNK